MLREEAAWLGSVLRLLPDDAFPLVNLGSSTAFFREVTQPFMNDLVFRPLTERGVDVLHVDVKSGEGIDVTCDFTDETDRLRLREHSAGIKTVVACNILEHLLISPAEAARHLIELVPPGGYVVVTVPHRYGYHADPIDNGFRPSPAELANLFVDACDIVEATETRGPILVRHHVRTKGLFRYFLRVATFWLYKPRIWNGLVSNFWRPALVACVVARRRA